MARLFADFGDAGEAVVAGGGEIGEDFRSDDVAFGSPDSEDGGETCRAVPLFDHIVDVKIFGGGDTGDRGFAHGFAIGAGPGFSAGGDGESQGRIADEKCGVGFSEHLGKIRGSLEKIRSDFPTVDTENSSEGLGAAGAAVKRDAGDVVDAFLGDEKKAADLSFGSDGHAGEDNEIVDALIFDGGNNGDVGGAGAKGFGALRWDREGEIVFALERTVRETPDQRGGVEVLDDGDAKFWHVWRSRRNRKSIAEGWLENGKSGILIGTEGMEGMTDSSRRLDAEVKGRQD